MGSATKTPPGRQTFPLVSKAVSDVRPAIGICTSLEYARWGVWDQRAALLPWGYMEAIQRAGGLVTMIPPDPVLVTHPDEMLDRIEQGACVGHF